jgi:hypothetical protein
MSDDFWRWHSLEEVNGARSQQILQRAKSGLSIASSGPFAIVGGQE